jgi:glutamate carboxypeptidase
VSRPIRRLGVCIAAVLATALFGIAAEQAAAQPVEPVLALAKKERQPLLDTLKELVSIETGSRDLEGLDRAAKLIGARLSALGGKVELVDTSEGAYRMEDTPAKIGKVVHARFEGRGTKKILLLAHMDTVYLRGMLAKQPFRVEGDRAYGLGIADDKNGVALILHVLAMLKAVFSCEASRVESDKLALATAGIASVILKVKGRASHAGAAPELGRNALYELAHQILQTRDLSNPETGLKMNWTLASGGSVRNAIPAEASATADVRVLRVSDYDGIERAVRERIRNKLIPDTQVEMTFERRRPPLEATPASRALGDHAGRIYAELGKKLVVDAVAEGGGTDAAFASLNTKAPVLERFGLQGFGAHSNDAEYVAVDSIEPRLYLLARLIMDVSQGKDRQ